MKKHIPVDDLESAFDGVQFDLWYRSGGPKRTKKARRNKAIHLLCDKNHQFVILQVNLIMFRKYLNEEENFC